MFERRKILVAEDNVQDLLTITSFLSSLGLDFVVAKKMSEVFDALSHDSFDYLLSDLHIETRAGIEEPDGIFVIKAAIERQPGIVIVANSSDPRTEIWNAALSAGAHHFIRKPISKADEIAIALGLARDRRILLAATSRASRNEVCGRWQKYMDSYSYGIILGEREIRRARGIARTKKASFVITGETGTGKEEVAKLIHRFRVEAEGPIPFVAVNCATITSNLAESQLFGHRKGSFTGADQTTNGYIGEADGGILFLDEIQTLEIGTQQKLLRVLNDGSYHRLGETRINRSQFQLIAASTKDLDIEVEAGRFLLDIRMRMTGLDLYLPPLRERLGDIPALTALFLSKRGIELSDEVFGELVEKLKTFHWSGNIRQLFKALEAWILACEFDEIPLHVEHLQVFKGMHANQKRQEPVQTGSETSDFLQALSKDEDFNLTVEKFEKAIILEALKRHRVIGDCCRALNISRSTLDAKRKKYGLL